MFSCPSRGESGFTFRGGPSFSLLDPKGIGGATRAGAAARRRDRRTSGVPESGDKSPHSKGAPFGVRELVPAFEGAFGKQSLGPEGVREPCRAIRFLVPDCVVIRRFSPGGVSALGVTWDSDLRRNS